MNAAHLSFSLVAACSLLWQTAHDLFLRVSELDGRASLPSDLP